MEKGFLPNGKLDMPYQLKRMKRIELEAQNFWNEEQMKAHKQTIKKIKEFINK
jgi:hypothetical protein